ncbi:hypothetical protein PMI42_03470 [Bradyrhizobium sp. YR681]|nr:hypothetical protein PMI42_03470 [Bradyrhizobium sp. YR681]
MQLAQATPASPSPAAPKVFAFAKASPLPVSDTEALTDSHPQNFEFGKAYEATEGPASYLKLKLQDDKYVYVRSTYLTTMGSPQWLASTSGYNRPDRPKIQFWESAVRLNEFLSGENRQSSQYDYEEYFEAEPSFQLKLPVVERDAVDVLGRQIKIMSVMMPISRQMYQAFETAKSGSERPIDLDFVVDVSGSTNGFLERAVGGVLKSLGRNEQLRKRIRSTVVATFGATRSNKSAFLGKMSLSEVEKVVWHPSGVDQTTDGEREPLLDGLVTMNNSLKADDAAAQVLVVLSGADVELATTASSLPVNIGNFELSLHTQPSAIFAQVTPEPGDDLKNASRQLKNVPRVRYVDYSEAMADEIVMELVRVGESQKNAVVSLRNFAPVLAAGNEKRMMTFLPRTLTPTSILPARPPYAAQSEWYTIRLWLTVNDSIWKETAQ